jgi:uncharacterized membrane protein HdeD (DUF308 family)
MLNKPENFGRNWGWLLCLGVLFVTLSFISLSKVVDITLISILFLGIIFIVAGGAQLIDVLKNKGWGASVWHAIIGLLYIIIGGLIIYDPVLTSSIITIFIAISLIIIGVSRFIMAILLKEKSPGWTFLIVNSLAAIILGGLILAHWPASSLLIIGLFITIELMISGWTYIFMSIAIGRNLK